MISYSVNSQLLFNLFRAKVDTITLLWLTSDYFQLDNATQFCSPRGDTSAGKELKSITDKKMPYEYQG